MKSHKILLSIVTTVILSVTLSSGVANAGSKDASWEDRCGFMWRNSSAYYGTSNYFPGLAATEATTTSSGSCTGGKVSTSVRYYATASTWKYSKAGGSQVTSREYRWGTGGYHAGGNVSTSRAKPSNV